MSQPVKHDYAKDIVIIGTVLFAIIELLIASGLLTIQSNPNLPPNLQTTAHWYDNPVVWVVGITVLVNFAGYIENVVIQHQTYDMKKFAETFFKYLPMLVLFSQFIPNQEAAVFAFALDYIARALKKQGNGNSTSATT